jgi:hypothetical protein
MKKIVLTAVALVLTTGATLAAPGYSPNGRHHERGSISASERAAIARSAAHLDAIKARAYRDGRLSYFERIQIRNAEARHRALVARAMRS